MDLVDKPISRRYLTQDDRIEIADRLAAGEPVKAIAARIGKAIRASTGRSRNRLAKRPLLTPVRPRPSPSTLAQDQRTLPRSG
ncbi:helix-turn-helix domain-containing protein [Arthrobacter sp. S2(2024)]|uniref:helix-turn-helix domain-containing protein n=1 Tax=Arthrobacter sp. S2(2024) TaxID=3111911 RepID=UPI003FA5B799